MVPSATRWWHQPDQFDWFTAYLDDRGLQTVWRATTFLFTVSLAAVPLVLIGSPTGPDNTVAVVVSIVAALCAAAGGSLWLTRWPTRRQSAWFTVAATFSIAATCSAQSDPYAALMGCTTFAIIGGFVAYFHTVRLVALVFAVAVVCAAVATYRLIAGTDDLALAASAFLIVLALNIGVPFGIHSLAHTLRSDLRSSGHDALTGLLNRRAFFHAAYELLMRTRSRGGAHLVVILIDLDNFKGLNDTQGHAVGDQALVAVGAALRDTCRDTAVIGRVGGEEFVIADSASTANPAEMAERVRKAISDTPFPVTASIGTASAPLDATAATADLDLINSLIGEADAAMYIAKRAGGNQVCHQVDADAANAEPVTQPR